MKPVCCSLHTCLREIAGAQPEKKLFGDRTRWLTAAQAWAAVSNAAGALIALGVYPGMPVALQTKRTLDSALLILALRAAGVLAMLCDPHQDPRTLLPACETPIPAEAVVYPERNGTFRVETGGETHVLNLYALPAAKPLPEGDPRGDGFVIFTSGSTGRSKAVVLSEYNLVNNLADSEPLGDYSREDIALGALPLEHVFGLVLLAGVPFLQYAIFFPEKTAVPDLLETIRREGITRMNGVPPLYQALAEQCAPGDLDSLRCGFIGGSPIPPARFAMMEERLGMTLIPVYGMTECIGISCADSHDPQEVRATGVGRIYSMNRGCILLDSGKEAAVGEIGEICVTGPARMNGYYGAPMPRDELFRTGDLGCLDENGVLHICGRKKEIIIRNGRNLSPRRIEEALLSLPGVRTAIVVGLPDEQTGEAPWAMITGRKVEISELESRLNKNELPRGICQVEELPLTASGKLDRQTIREVLLQWRKG